MRHDLIGLIEDQDDVTNAIVLTHNIDFVFLQMIVLPALRRCGRPALTVFADAHCAAESFAHQAPALGTLGTRYRVVPVAMEPGFRFHPKALMLSGPTKATLWIGSGNLTYGGWRDNGEVWLRYETDQDSTSAFTAFRAYLDDVLTRVPLSGPVRDEVDEAFDSQTRSWARELEPPSGLIGRVGKGESLLDRIVALRGDDDVSRLIICSPYFDPEGEALRNLIARLRPAAVEVLLQKEHVGLSREAAAGLPPGVRLVPIQFTRTLANQSERASFVHAKFYGLETATRCLVLVGSANCSRAALTIPGSDGNAELLALQESTADAFRELYLAELPHVSGELKFPEAVAKPEEGAPPPPLRVLAARHENGVVRVAYMAADGVVPTRCRGGGMVSDFVVEKPGLGWAQFVQAPSRLILEGVLADNSVQSAETWVDQERELRATARSRTFAGAVRDSVQAGRWGIGAWKDILDVFCKHLQYLPARSEGPVHVDAEKKAKRIAEFTADDVFASGYGLPHLGSALRAGPIDDNVLSLQQMLLRWFGIPLHDDLPTQGQDEGPDGEEEENGGVDRPEAFPKAKAGPAPPPKPTAGDRRRAAKSVGQLTKAMCSPEFLAQRSPELLAADLKIVYVLLRTALTQGWIATEDYFETTRLVWASLFFSSADRQEEGWLERRYRQAEDPAGFALSMASPELSAALAGWSALPAGSANKSNVAAHLFTQVLAAARLPWLWRGGQTERIAEELGEMITNTEGQLSEQRDLEARDSWLQLVRRGEALRALEKCLVDRTPVELAKRVSGDTLSSGELLWQGPSGYCVLLEDCRRSQVTKVRVVKLRGVAGEALFSAQYLVPLRTLLDPSVLPGTHDFNLAQRETLQRFLSELEALFAHKEPAHEKPTG
jgi:hypothetical protein